MIELVQANWPLFLAAIVIGILVAWLIFVGMRRTRVETTRTDVLDDGSPAATRNQALIDSAPMANDGGTTPLAPATPPGLAGGVAAITASETATVERNSATPVAPLNPGQIRSQIQGQTQGRMATTCPA